MNGNTPRDIENETGTDTTDAQVTGAERADSGNSVLTQAGGAIASGAAGASGALTRGFSDVRDVRRASREHGRARGELERMQTTLDEDKATLERRRYVEENYDDIIAQQTLAAKAAHEKSVEASKALDEATSERTYLAASLDAMKKQHEEELVPYRNLLETAQGRADDTARILAESKRAVKTAEAQVANATTQRDMQVSAASRAQDNASDRLAKLQGELDRMKGDADMKARSELQGEIAAELAHLDTARADVGATTETTQRAVKPAQTHLWTQKQSLEVAQRDHDAAKEAVTERREELDRMAKRFRAQEDELKDKIEVLDRRIEARNADHEASLEREREAYGLVAEAREIRATPSETYRLAAQIKRDEAKIAEKREAVEDLAADVDDLKRSTRSSRLVFLGVCAAVVVVLVVILIMVLMPR